MWKVRVFFCLVNDLEIIHRSIVVRRVDVIQWSEELYERILIDRTIDACKGQVDVVIDFGTTSRSLNRSIQCLSKGGVVFIGHETADRLMPKFARKAEEHHITIQPVELGSLDQLKELVQLVSSGEVKHICLLLYRIVNHLAFETGATASVQRVSS
jgi:D-arabinose 1-dehydrogenase-like Zn-dependent alcohol dehydrogenase